ncbi:MAG: DUF1161 domain-containing protein [Panacagrimonas sp.]
MAIPKLLLGLILVTVAASVQAGKDKDCEELRAEIDARLQSKGVKGFSLDIVEAGDTGSARVVGTCDGGRHRIVYARGGGRPTPTPAEPKSSPPSAKKKKNAAPAPALGNY